MLQLKWEMFWVDSSGRSVGGSSRHQTFHTNTITVSVTYQIISKWKHSKDYGEMTILLLKQELSLRKAKLSGKKGSTNWKLS